MSRATTLIAAAALALAALALWLGAREVISPADSSPAPAPVAARAPRLPPPPFDVPAPSPEPEEAPEAPAAEAPPPSPMAHLVLQLLEADGAPATGAVLWVSELPGAETAVVQPDRAGVVRGWLRPGRWRLEGRGANGTAGPLEVSLAAGQRLQHTLWFGTRRRVAGVVVNEAGQTPPRTQVRLLDGTSSLGFGGGVFQHETTRSAVTVVAEADGFARKTVRVEAPNADVRIVLTAGAELTVSVVDEAGEAVADACVDVTSGDFHAPDPTGDGRCARSVRPVEVASIPSGVATVRAVRLTARGLERASKEVPLAPGEKASAVLQLKPGAGLEGEVVGPGGAPLAQVRVVALSLERDATRTVTDFERSVLSAQTTARDAVGFTGPDGRFNLVPGQVSGPDVQYRLQVLGPGLREPAHLAAQELGGPPVRLVLVPLGPRPDAGAGE